MSYELECFTLDYELNERVGYLGITYAMNCAMQQLAVR